MVWERSYPAPWVYSSLNVNIRAVSEALFNGEDAQIFGQAQRRSVLTGINEGEQTVTALVLQKAEAGKPPLCRFGTYSERRYLLRRQRKIGGESKYRCDCINDVA